MVSSQLVELAMVLNNLSGSVRIGDSLVRSRFEGRVGSILKEKLEGLVSAWRRHDVSRRLDRHCGTLDSALSLLAMMAMKNNFGKRTLTNSLLGATAFLLFASGCSAQTTTISAVVNGASFTQGPMAPGSIISIFGTGLARSTAAASTLPLPSSLNGTQVVVIGGDGSRLAVPIFFVSPGQINAQLPFQIQPGSAQLMVTGTGTTAAIRAMSISAAAPAIFTTTADGKGEAISVHADFRLVKKEVGQNATAGETIILFCTGLGSVDNFDNAGAAAPASQLANTTQKPTVLMDGRSAQVTFSGLAPGFIGLYQVNFVVPQGVGGDVVTTLRVGDASSNPVAINVRGTYTVGANYLGRLEYRTGQTFNLEFNSFASTSPTKFSGIYRALNGTAVVDTGSFQIENTRGLFIGTGRSPGFNQTFTVVMDTLDAGKSFSGILYDADSLAKVTDFDTWYASFAVVLSTPQPAPSPVLRGISSGCATVEGALIFAGNTFLGRVTSNTFAADSLGNPYGSYGSQFSQTSIFNTFGPYGSLFSVTSAFNDLASNPPIISKGAESAYLTTNQIKSPRIDPRALFPCIGR